MYVYLNTNEVYTLSASRYLVDHVTAANKNTYFIKYSLIINKLSRLNPFDVKILI